MPVAKIQVAEVEVAALVPSKHNPKARAADPGSLVSSIRELGLIHPIPVFREGGKFKMLAGHRRLAAVKVLGWSKVTVVVHPKPSGAGDDEHQQLLRMLAENEVREDLRPLEGARLVKRLLGKLDSDTHERVSEVLGRSVKWVARRANLLRLSPRWTKEVDGGRFKDWPPSWIEEVALLAPNAQDRLLRKEGYFDHAERLLRVQSYDELVDVIAERLHTLRHAPWDLDDAKLLPRAGACSACPHTSCARPGLFGPLTDAPDVRAAQCTDETCWAKKLVAWIKRRRKEVEAEHRGQQVFLLRSEGHDEGGGRRRAPSEVRKKAFGDEAVLGHWEWHLKPKSKGGVPGLVVEGRRFGKLVYFAKGSKWSPDPGRPKGAPKPLKEKRAALANRRSFVVMDQLVERTEEIEWKTVRQGLLSKERKVAAASGAEDGALLDLLAAVGTGDFQPVLDLPALTADKRRLRLFEFARERLVDAIASQRNQARNWKQGSEQLKRLRALAAVLGFDVEALCKEAAEQLPEPKSWKAQAAKERATKKAAPKKAKAKAKPRRKAKRAGR